MKENRLITAGKELIKLNFGNVFKSLLPQSQWQSGAFGAGDYRGYDDDYFGENNPDQWYMFGPEAAWEYPFTSGNRNAFLKAYTSCPPVAAIVNRKAQAYINGKTFIMNSQGKGRDKESTSPVAAKIRKLMTRPNPLQSWSQFEAQAYIFQQIFGFAIILPIIPVGYTQYGPSEATSIWNIPPYLVKIEESEDLYYNSKAKIIKKITLNYKNTQTDIDPDTIFILKDFTPSCNSLIIPESRLLSMQMPVNNITGALESRGVIINRRGPDFIVSNEKDQHGYVPIQPDEKTKLERAFSRYGLRKSQSRAVFTSAAVKYQAMGFSVRELMLIEEVAESTKSLCDGFNYPPHLLGLIDPTFNNQASAEKGLYNNAIIPESLSNYEQLNQIFRTEEYNLRIEKDYKHVAALQEDQLDQAMARLRRNEGALVEFQNNLITINDWRALNNDDAISQPWADLYYFQIVALGMAMGQGKSSSSVPDTVTQPSSNGAAISNPN